MPYTCFCDRVVFSKEDIVSIEILFCLWYFYGIADKTVSQIGVDFLSD